MTREGAVDTGQEFECFIAHLNGWAEVVIRGEVDIDSAARLAEVVEAAVMASPHVVFNMGDVTFLDSSGLHVASRALEKLPPGAITIRNAAPRILRVFEVSGMADLFHWDFESPAAAPPESSAREC
jgi:anti-anti-sigma factor